MKVTVNETERGFLFKKGRFVKMLQPGTYYVFGSTTIQKANIGVGKLLGEIFSDANLAAFAADPDFAKETMTVNIPDGNIGLLYADGRYQWALPAGTHHFWNNIKQHTVEIYDTTDPYVPDSIPRHLCETLCQSKYMFSVCVPEQSKGILRFDNKQEAILNAGVYYFWENATRITCDLADLRQQQLSITGQEILTKDKANIRLNFVCTYRFADFVKAFTEIKDYASQLYIAVQMTMREYVAGYTLDELLAQRENIAAEVTAQLKEKAASLHIEIIETGIRDIILPGEVRDIMNTVLIAEKRAQANVITRREEVASTRSLLNTAKLMDENKTLYKLKELEYLEKICENVGNISVSGGDLLAQLREILGTRA